MTKRVLLTGASGFIGANVLEWMLERTDWTFVCPCSFRHKGDPKRLWPLYEPNRDRVEVPTVDLASPIRDLGPVDVILNLASESHVDRSISDPCDFIDNNVNLTLNLLEYARSHQPELFIQFSTDEVFGAGGGIRRPNDRPLPSSPYAASKACQEMVALAYARTYGVPVIITNSSNVIGPGQDPEKFPAKVYEAILLEREVDIHVDDRGEYGARIYNPVPNVASALEFLVDHAEHVRKFHHGGRFLIGGGSKRTNLELAESIAKALGVELRFQLVPVAPIRPGYDTEYAYLDGSKLLDLGWRPETDLNAYLAEMFK